MSEVQTVSGATEHTILPRMIEASAGEFGKVLPRALGPEKFARWALTVYRKGIASPDDRQREAWAKVAAHEPGRLSVISALMDCASLGLEPGREFHLVPFGGTVTGITDYKGEIKLITNARPCSVVAQLVRKGDLYYMTGANIPPRHEPPGEAGDDSAERWFGEDRPVIGGYAYVAYDNRECSLVMRLTEEDFARHRAKSKTANRTDSPWQEWPEAMRLKTLVHQLRKFVPWSAERMF